MIKHVPGGARADPRAARELAARRRARARSRRATRRARGGRRGDDGRGARRDGARMSAPLHRQAAALRGAARSPPAPHQEERGRDHRHPDRDDHRPVPRACSSGAARAEPRRRRRVPRDGGDAHLHQVPHAAAARTDDERGRRGGSARRAGAAARSSTSATARRRSRSASATCSTRDVFAPPGEPYQAARGRRGGPARPRREPRRPARTRSARCSSASAARCRTRSSDEAISVARLRRAHPGALRARGRGRVHEPVRPGASRARGHRHLSWRCSS